MDTDAHHERGLDSGVVLRIVRYVIALALLFVVVLVFAGIVGEYRDARSQGSGTTSEETTGSVVSTGSAESTAVPEVEPTTGEVTAGQTVVVLTDGLNLRTDAVTSSIVIKRLALDSRLTLLEVATGWYRVRDAEGVEGWVAAGGQYTRVE
ncbi:MAG: SH3 domain-containing protein [Coriobacteriia bacterium]|nr:SH3 domain-containing protein [Coriobacteriia bacterium]